MFSNPSKARAFGAPGAGEASRPISLGEMIQQVRQHPAAESSTSARTQSSRYHARAAPTLRSQGTMSPEVTMGPADANDLGVPDAEAHLSQTAMRPPSQKRKQHDDADDSGFAAFGDADDEDSQPRTRRNVPALKAKKKSSGPINGLKKASTQALHKKQKMYASQSAHVGPISSQPLVTSVTVNIPTASASASNAAVPRHLQKPAAISNQVLNLPGIMSTGNLPSARPSIAIVPADQPTDASLGYKTEKSEQRTSATHHSERDSLSLNTDNTRDVAERDAYMHTSAQDEDELRDDDAPELDEEADNDAHNTTPRDDPPSQPLRVTKPKAWPASAERQRHANDEIDTSTLVDAGAAAAASSIKSDKLAGEGKVAKAIALRDDCICGKCEKATEDDHYDSQAMEDWLNEGKDRMDKMSKLFNKFLEVSLERETKIQAVIDDVDKYGQTMMKKKSDFAKQQKDAGKWMSTGFWVKAETQE